MAWQPEGEDRKFLELISSMTTSTMLGTGVDTRETYLANLQMMLDSMQGKTAPVSPEQQAAWEEELDRLGYGSQPEEDPPKSGNIGPGAWIG